MDARDVVTVPAQGDDADPPVRLGHFDLGARLGEGGMGVVFQARDTLLGRDVALKLLRGGSEAGAVARARLLQEAQTLARLSHPNVVTVFEVGVAGDDVFVAMELLEGATLTEWLATPRDWRAIADVFIAVGRGLAAVHALDLVHRDVKPSNVLMDRVGVPKLGDFGLVCHAGEPAGGRAMGTPAYMAPEQLRGDAADARFDQYAFATAFAEALGDRAPPRLRAILARARAEDPDARFSSMDALLVELARARRGAKHLWIAGAGVATVAGVAVLAWTLSRSDRPAAAVEPCPVPAQALATMWGDATRAAAQARVVALDPATGEARFATSARGVDTFVGAWRDLHVEACRANRGEQRQSDTLYDQRITCLDRRAAELAASLALVTGAADAKSLDGALRGLLELTPVATCADTDALGRAAPPLEPEARAAADALAARITDLEVRARADQIVGLPAIAAAVVDDARRLGHAPTLTAALAAAAAVQADTQDDTAAATTLRELTQVAARAHDFEAEALAWIQLLERVGVRQGKIDEALALVPAASAAVLRAGEPVRLRALLLYGEAQVLGNTPRREEALAKLEEARALLEASAPDDPYLPGVLLQIGTTYAWLHDYIKAQEALDAALPVTRRIFGPDSIDEAMIWHNRGTVEVFAQVPEDALASFGEAARINAARVGDSPRLAVNLTSIAAAHAKLGRWAEALAGYDRALEMHRRTGAPGAELPTMLLASRAKALAQNDRVDEALAAYAELVAQFDRTKATNTNFPIALFDRAELLAGHGRCEEALADYRRAAAEFEAQFDAVVLYLLYPLVSEGRCLIQLGRPADAIAPLSRAVSIIIPQANAMQSSLARAWLGRAQVEARRDRAAALARVRAERATLAAAIAEEPPEAAADLAELDAWLAKHPR